MSQDWVSNVYDDTHVIDTDLDNIELMLESLRTNFSGNSQPSSGVTGQLWYDANDYVMRMKEAATSWTVGLMHGDVDQKIWVYRNAAINGWAIDGGVSDVVLALKGGTTFVAGAATAGTWTISGLSHTHTVVNHTHTIGSEIVGVNTTYAAAYAGGEGGGTPVTVVTSNIAHAHGSVTGGATPATSSSGASDGLWRISSAVGTLQFLDL